jgi:hypothetical protein
VEELIRRGITLLVVDSFIKSHRVSENKNEHIDFVATLWSEVADRANCVVLLVHHFRKGGSSGDADAFRGASALIDASRAAVSVARMTEEEAEKLGIEPRERRSYIRVDNAKLNLAKEPDEVTWMKLHSIVLPNGDDVQTVGKWDPPSPWDGVPWSLVIRVLDKLRGEPSEGEQYSLNQRSKDRWAGKVVIDELGRTEKQAKTMLRAWEKNELLVETTYIRPGNRNEAKGLRVDENKVTQMKREHLDAQHHN